jgi:hypothetical protein
MVLDTLAKGVRQSRKPSHAHSHGEVCPFNVAGRNVPRVRIALERLFPGPYALGRTVAGLCIGGDGRDAIQLDELGEVNAMRESALHSIQIGTMPVRGQLDAVGKAAGNIIHEDVRALGIPATYQPRDDQLAIGIQGRPRPDIARAFRRILGVGEVLGLRVAERPDFVALDALGFDTLLFSPLGPLGMTTPVLLCPKHTRITCPYRIPSQGPDFSN